MGIYYYAIEENSKTIFSAPGYFNNKSPGIYAPGNPFPAIVIMKNSQGHFYEIINDMQTIYEECCSWKDITDQVYEELKKSQPQWVEVK